MRDAAMQVVGATARLRVNMAVETPEAMPEAPVEFGYLRKPDDYKPPRFDAIELELRRLKVERQPFLEREWEVKQRLRGDWNDVLRTVPQAFRKLLIPPDLPQVRDMVFRVSGMIRKRPMRIDVHPPSPSPSAVKRAAAEEKRLNAVPRQIAEQKGRDVYAMGIDAQVRYGESWICVFPDARRLGHPGFKRKPGETAAAYNRRYREVAAYQGLPLGLDDIDPASVFARRADDDSLAFAIVETEHSTSDINTGLGYRALKDSEGKTSSWVPSGRTLSQPFVSSETPQGDRKVDVDHDTTSGVRGSTPVMEAPVKKVVYMDPWVYQLYLDGILAEEWEHDCGIVPLFGAYGADEADRTPGYESHGLIEPALKIAKQVVFFATIMATSAALYGYRTPFVKNASWGITQRTGTNAPATREIVLGEMNLLHGSEEIVFPFQEGGMGKEFLQYMDFLNGQLSESTLSNFGQALGSDMAGYAIAQIRSMQLSSLAPVYRNAERQWAGIMYFVRYLVKSRYVPPLYMRGAVEESEEGQRFRPVMDYAPSDVTDYPISCTVDEGIPQDEIAERKSAIEMNQAGIWSKRRVMEHTGVDDPSLEEEEIRLDAVRNSDGYYQLLLGMAAQIASQREMAVGEAETGTPFMQALERAKQHMAGGGQFQNQGGSPANADAGGTPVNQRPRGVGINLDQMAVPKLPGGVQDVQQTPVGAPG